MSVPPGPHGHTASAIGEHPQFCPYEGAVPEGQTEMREEQGRGRELVPRSTSVHHTSLENCQGVCPRVCISTGGPIPHTLILVWNHLLTPFCPPGDFSVSLPITHSVPPSGNDPLHPTRMSAIFVCICQSTLYSKCYPTVHFSVRKTLSQYRIGPQSSSLVSALKDNLILFYSQSLTFYLGTCAFFEVFIKNLSAPGVTKWSHRCLRSFM